MTVDRFKVWFLVAMIGHHAVLIGAIIAWGWIGFYLGIATSLAIGQAIKGALDELIEVLHWVLEGAEA